MIDVFEAARTSRRPVELRRKAPDPFKQRRGDALDPLPTLPLWPVGDLEWLAVQWNDRHPGEPRLERVALATVAELYDVVERPWPLVIPPVDLRRPVSWTGHGPVAFLEAWALIARFRLAVAFNYRKRGHTRRDPLEVRQVQDVRLGDPDPKTGAILRVTTWDRDRQGPRAFIFQKMGQVAALADQQPPTWTDAGYVGELRGGAGGEL